MGPCSPRTTEEDAATAGSRSAELRELLARLRDGDGVTSQDLEIARRRASEARARAEKVRRDADLRLAAHAASHLRAAQYWDSLGRLDRAAELTIRAAEIEAAVAGVLKGPPVLAPIELHPTHHDAVFFRSEDELVAAATPWLAEGAAAGELVVLGCTEPMNRAVAHVLGKHCPIVYLPTRVMYKNAVTTISYLRRFLRRQLSSGASGIRLLAQPDFGSSPTSWDEWRQFEAMCNRAWRDEPLQMLCAYDTRAVPDAVLGTAELTHPYLLRDGAREPNHYFVEPVELLRLAGPEGDLPEVEPTLWVRQVRDTYRLRERLRDLLRRGHVPEEVSEDFVQVVHELASNGVLHGSPPVSVRVWLFPDRLACAVTDQGLGFSAPLDPSASEQEPAGMGLRLARHICDDVVVVRNAEGFTVRAVTRRRASSWHPK